MQRMVLSYSYPRARVLESICRNHKFQSDTSAERCLSPPESAKSSSLSPRTPAGLFASGIDVYTLAPLCS
jgi:hypothetical protein